MEFNNRIQSSLFSLWIYECAGENEFCLVLLALQVGSIRRNDPFYVQVKQDIAQFWIPTLDLYLEDFSGVGWLTLARLRLSSSFYSCRTCHGFDLVLEEPLYIPYESSSSSPLCFLLWSLTVYSGWQIVLIVLDWKLALFRSNFFKYRYIRNHKKTIKNKRERKSEQKPEARARKSQILGQALVNLGQKKSTTKVKTQIVPL
ncbi:hypothetical protein Tco_0514032 [Tanacetum coccineum]